MRKNMLGAAAQDYAAPIQDFRQKLKGSDGKEWLEAFKRFLRKENPWPVPTAAPAPATSVPSTATEFSLPVNYDRSIEEARKEGKYDWENSDITSKNFPTTRKGTADIVLHIRHFDREITSEKAIEEMDKLGLRPAETHELLALGAAHPDLQRQFPIIALGSVWQDRGDYCVPYLNRVDSERDLGLSWFGSGWDASYRFAAVPK